MSRLGNPYISGNGLVLVFTDIAYPKYRGTVYFVERSSISDSWGLFKTQVPNE